MVFLARYSFLAPDGLALIKEGWIAVWIFWIGTSFIAGTVEDANILPIATGGEAVLICVTRI